MKKSHKELLKSMLITSMAAIGMPNDAKAAPFIAITKEELMNMGSENMNLSDALMNTTLSPSYAMEESGFTSHESHVSHVSHKSHVSSGSSSGSSSVGINGGAVAAVVGIAGVGVGLYALIHALVKSKSQDKVNMMMPEVNLHSYGSRDIYPDMYGQDVNELIELLIENGAMDRADREFYKYTSIAKFNSASKKGLKKMHAVMGSMNKKNARRPFLMDLKRWKDTRQHYINGLASDTIDLKKNNEALIAVAILLVEKGYLKDYHKDLIEYDIEKNRILSAYHRFLKANRRRESDIITPELFVLLYKHPGKKKIKDSVYE